MTEQQLIMRNLVFWHKVFAICFIAYIVLALVIGSHLLKEISAYDQCATADDSAFSSCYSAAKN